MSEKMSGATPGEDLPGVPGSQGDFNLAGDEWQRALFATNLTGIFISDPQTSRIVAANPALCRMIGDSEAHLCSLLATALYDMRDPRLTAALVTRELTGSFTGEINVRRADGALFPADVTSRYFTTLEGKRLAIHALTDVSARKAAERAVAAGLGQYEQIYRQLAERSSDLIWTVDERGDFTYLGPSLTGISGFAPEEHVGQRIGAHAVLASQLQINDLLAAWVDAASNGRPLPTEAVLTQHLAKDGRLLWFETNVIAVQNPQGEFAGLAGISRNVTDRIAYEQFLQDTNTELEQRVAERTAELRNLVVELERANAGKDAFFAAVSHELRTPLTGILGMAESLGDEVRGPLNEAQRRYVDAIQTSGERLLNMVTSILNYTHAMGDTSPGKIATCRLAELCAVSVKAARPKAEQRHQKIVVDIHPIDLQIISNGESIMQILSSLLDNAIKFTPDAGRIGLEVSPVDADRAVQIAVWDTGIGIAPEQMAYLFKPLTQVDQRLARQYEGIGLGLAFVKRKVELLGGTIDVESTPGAGSRFIVTLPSNPPA